MCSMQTFWNFHIKYKRCYLQPFALCVFFKYRSLQKHENPGSLKRLEGAT